MSNAPFGSTPCPPIDMRVSAPSFCTRVLDKRYARERVWVIANCQGGRTATRSQRAIAPIPPMSRPLGPHTMLCTESCGVLGGARATTVGIGLRCGICERRVCRLCLQTLHDWCMGNKGFRFIDVGHRCRRGVLTLGVIAFRVIASAAEGEQAIALPT